MDLELAQKFPKPEEQEGYSSGNSWHPSLAGATNRKRMVLTYLDGDAILMFDSGFYCIADRYGFYWETVWGHANNAGLRDLRKEANVLLAGDEVFVPEKRLRQESCSTDQCHQFVRKGIPTLLRMRFLDGGEPRGDVPYVLTVDGQVLQGSTDKDRIVQERVRANAKKAMLQLGSGIRPKFMR